MPTPAESPFYAVQGATLVLLKPLDLSDREQVEGYRRAACEIARAGHAEVVLDFTRPTILTSTIITLAFLVTKDLKGEKARIHILASMQTHRALVSSGMSSYFELSLCS